MRAPASQPEVATFGLCVFRSRASLARVALPRRFRRPLRPHLPVFLLPPLSRLSTSSSSSLQSPSGGEINKCRAPFAFFLSLHFSPGTSVHCTHSRAHCFCQKVTSLPTDLSDGKPAPRPKFIKSTGRSRVNALSVLRVQKC